MRVHRRRWRLVIAFMVICTCLLAAYAVSWASYLPKYSVQTVTISGNDAVPTKLLYDYVESLIYTGGHPFLSKSNIFLYNPSAIEREIVGYFPRISQATVSRASLLATSVTVTVDEREPYALWCADAAQSNCYQMDETGFIFAQVPSAQVPSYTATSSSAVNAFFSSSQSRGYVFEGGVGSSTSTSTSTEAQDAQNPQKNPIGHTFVSAHMPGILTLLKMLGQAGFAPLGARVDSEQDFSVPITQGFYVKASYGEDPERIVSNLQLVLSSDALAGHINQLEYVDLRFGDRVYYKLQGADEVTTSSSSS